MTQNTKPSVILSSGDYLDPGVIVNLLAAALLVEWPQFSTVIFVEHKEIYLDVTGSDLRTASEEKQAAAFRLLCSLTRLITEQELGYRWMLVKD